MSKKRGSSVGIGNSLDNETAKKQKFSPDLSGVRAVIVEVGLGKTRASILKKQLERHRGKHHKKLESGTTHVLIDKKLKTERLKKYLAVTDIPEEVKVVDSEWLSKCLSEGKLVEIEQYILSKEDFEVVEKGANEASVSNTYDGGQSSEPAILKPLGASLEAEAGISSASDSVSSTSRSPTKHSASKIQDPRDDDSDYTDSGDEGSKSDRSPVITSNVSPEKFQTSWVRAQASTSQQQNRNQFIIDKLQVLATSYANTKDQWRALGYKKTIASIKNYHKKLET